jgi:hypothetical protein
VPRAEGERRCRPPGPARVSRVCLTAGRLAEARHTGEPGDADG